LWCQLYTETRSTISASCERRFRCCCFRSREAKVERLCLATRAGCTEDPTATERGLLEEPPQDCVQCNVYATAVTESLSFRGGHSASQLYMCSSPCVFSHRQAATVPVLLLRRLWAVSENALFCFWLQSSANRVYVYKRTRGVKARSTPSFNQPLPTSLLTKWTQLSPPPRQKEGGAQHCRTRRKRSVPVQ